MNSPKNYLIGLLALTTIGGAYLAWQQYGELVELRAAALNKDERSDLQKRVWDLDKTNKQLNERLTAQARTGDPESPLATVPAMEGRAGRGPGNPMQQMNALRDLMAKPEVQALINVQQKARIDAQYAALFKNLNLSPEQTEKLKTILADRQTTLQDASAAAREQGIDPRRDPDSYQKLMASVQSDINASIKSVLGDSGFTQFESYEKTLPQRNVVNQLQQRLSYTDTPLTTTQAEQLVQILASNTPVRPAANVITATPIAPPPPGPRSPDLGALGAVIGNLAGSGPGGGLLALAGDGGRSLTTAPVTSTAINQSQAVLSAPQVAALQQIQQQQQSQQQLAKLIGETMGPQGGRGGTPPPTTPPPRGGD